MSREYEPGALWRHKDNGKLVEIISVSEPESNFSQVAFKYRDMGPNPYGTSVPLFQLFFEPVSEEETGMILLNDLE